ncbi:MAG: universal stress protein [Halobacteriales archaeon]|nr:universal stress protein [Halobacteriales archaeon]
MYTVLLPVDEAVGPARRQAEFVASLPAAGEAIEVTLTHSMAANESLDEDELASLSQVESVQTAKDHLVANDVDVETMAVSLPLEDGIPQLAEQIDADQIVMGGRKRSAAGKALFGSITQAVILNTNRSVTVVGSQD